MLILVPMAGFGDRYLRAGYTHPKPLIPVDGKPMIERVLEAFTPRAADDRYLFVVNRTHAETTDLVPTLQRLVPDAQIVVVEPHKDGPVHTLLAAEPHVAPDEEVILNYCDFGVDWSYPEFRAWLAEHQWDGAMSAYRGFHPHSLGPTLYAYMRMAEDDQTVVEIREKHHFTPDKFSEYASSGLYYFRRAETLFRIAKEQMQRGERVQGEFYVSMAVQALIAEGGKVGAFPLPHFYQWGTPADLRDWESWAAAMRGLDTFVRQMEASQTNAAQVVPMAGLGQRFRDRGYTDPKPLIDVAGKPMIEQVLAMLPSAPSRTLIALEEHVGDARLQTTVRRRGAELVAIPALSRGQASTAMVGCERLPADSSVWFAPCDTGCWFDVAAFEVLTQSSDADLIVFTARGHLPALWRPQMYGWVVAEQGWARQCAVKQLVEGIPAEQQEVVVGTFWFAENQRFQAEYRAMVDDDDTVNGEFYIDTIARRMIARGAKVRAFTVDKYMPWGTPEELETFRYWNDVFRGGRAL